MPIGRPGVTLRGDRLQDQQGPKVCPVSGSIEEAQGLVQTSGPQLLTIRLRVVALRVVTIAGRDQLSYEEFLSRRTVRRVGRAVCMAYSK